MPITIHWLGHASFKITASLKIYIDPWKIKDSPNDADVVLISHDHYDHYVAEDIQKVSSPNTRLFASADVIKKHGSGQPLTPDQSLQIDQLNLTVTCAYNIGKDFHPREMNWLGFILELDEKRIYYAGDTDQIPEMNEVKNIDLALLPVGGTYTMDPAQAAEVANQLNPKAALPYHWGDIVGTRKDADNFAKQSNIPTIILNPNQSTTLE